MKSPVHPARHRRQLRWEAALAAVKSRAQARVAETGGASLAPLRVDLHGESPDATVRRWGAGEADRERWAREQRLAGLDAIVDFSSGAGAAADVLPAAAFRVFFPGGARPRIDVYGALPADRAALSSLVDRPEAFLAYARKASLPAVLVHPFEDGNLSDLDFLASIPDRFGLVSGLFGRADLEVSLFFLEWIARRAPDLGLTGGTGDATGLLAGSAWTTAWVDPSLPVADGLLAALREGRVYPEGVFPSLESEAAVKLLRCIDAIHGGEDPGLELAMGGGPSWVDRAADLVVANALAGARKTVWARRSARVIDAALTGARRLPAWVKNIGPREFRPYVRELEALGTMRRRHPKDAVRRTGAFLERMVNQALRQLAPRAVRLAARLEEDASLRPDWSAPIPALVLQQIWTKRPSLVRVLRGRWFASVPGLPSALVRELDPLVIPFAVASAMTALAALTLRSRSGAPARRRAAMNHLGMTAAPGRLLWITDTFHDHNGVSRFLQSFHAEAIRRGLPVDFLIVSGEKKPEPGLLVLAPKIEFRAKDYPDQVFRLPDPLELLHVLEDGGYGAVLTSTEGPFGLAALLAKEVLGIPAWIYMHTDWIDFARKTLKFPERRLGVLSAFLGALYRRYDGVFVLNETHRRWLASPEVGVDPARIRKTAHWADAAFVPGPDERPSLFGAAAGETVFFFAGRISEEKGVFELVAVQERLRASGARGKLVIAGSGPALERLRAALPDALFLGWVDAAALPRHYASADVLLMPSRFDTFGCVVLESLSCGLPVVAYRAKGPADIVQDGVSGFLVDDADGMAAAADRIAADPELRRRLREGALRRAEDYRAEKIADDLLRDILPDLSGAGSP